VVGVHEENVLDGHVEMCVVEVIKRVGREEMNGHLDWLKMENLQNFFVLFGNVEKVKGGIEKRNK